MSKYEIGDKFEIEIEEKFYDNKGGCLYRMKPFKSLVFDDNGLDKLKKIEDELILKPCPMCGRMDTVSCETRVGEIVGTYYVVCDASIGGCGASSGRTRTKEEAIELWNRRA